MTLADYFELPTRFTDAPTDQRLKELMNGQLKWLTNTYVAPTDLTSSIEVNIRGAAMAAYAMAVTVQGQVYDPTLSGVPNYMTAVTKANSLINGVCAGHVSNHAGGWGHGWQSALWAATTALAGWMNAGYLTGTQLNAMLTMVESEADWRLTQVPRFMYAPDGTVLTPGDTGAEENIWNAMLPAVAYCMMPTHPHAAQWLSNAVLFWAGSFTHRDDLTSGAVVNGLALSSLGGYNIEPDYTVTNHGITPDPDYMTCISIGGWAAAAFGLAGRAVPEAAFWNYDKVYAQLSTPLPAYSGATIYMPGQPLPSIYYPAGNDWGARRPTAYSGTDQIAAAYDLGGLSTRAPRYWERVHVYDAWSMQKRYTDGHLYAPSGEDSYGAREQLAAFNVATGWLALWLGYFGRTTISTEVL